MCEQALPHTYVPVQLFSSKERPKEKKSKKCKRRGEHEGIGRGVSCFCSFVLLTLLYQTLIYISNTMPVYLLRGFCRFVFVNIRVSMNGQ